MVRRRIGLAAVLLCVLPAMGIAQSTATLLGTVTDESQAVLPGVTVTVTEVASGRQYVATTDANGEYRLPSVVPGTYRVQAELSGFSTVVIPGLELQVSQIATVPLSLKVAAVEETVTISGEAPLVNTRSALVGTNVDRRQMKELPILGRNWMEMSLLVKGVTVNTMAGNRAGMQRDDQFQLNLDGQQITQNMSLADFFGQPRLSREAISEFAQNVSGYDVTQGRSVGVTVQAISRSGTNDLHGTVYGNFRDDKFVAKDFITQSVLPFSNTQAGFSLGGPIAENKLHYFGTYEYERQPGTVVVTPQAYAGEQMTFANTVRHHQTLLRGDYQMSDRDHFNARLTHWDGNFPNNGLTAGMYPTSAIDSTRFNLNLVGTWSRVMSDNLFQEIRAGYTRYEFANVPGVEVPLTPVYVMPTGFPDIGTSRSIPQEWFQRTPSIRYDLTWHRGRHDVKLGGEYLGRLDGANWPNQARGVFTIDGVSSGGATTPMTAAEFTRRFPLDAWNDPSRWDLNGLSASQFLQAFSNDFQIDLPRKTWALWAHDTWAVNGRLTLNYGVRWDVDWGAIDPPGSVDYPVILSNGFDPDGFNGGYTSGLRDLGNVAPRGGVTYRLTDAFVVRGGAGLFFTFPESNAISGPQQQINNTLHKVITATFFNNQRRADFMTNPLGAVTPDEILATTTPTPAIPVNLRNFAPDFRNPRTLQANAGFQQQLGPVFGYDADLIYTKGMHLATDRDVNLFYDDATGYPKNPRLAGVGTPRPDFGTIRYFESDLESESLALATSFTRRLRDRWQMGGTYTLSFYNKDMGSSGFGYIAGFSNPFCVECEWANSTAYQRHTLRVNGIYEAPWGITLSGIYSFGSGNLQNLSYSASTTHPVGTGSRTTGTFGINRFVTAPVTLPGTATFPDGSVHDISDLLAGGTRMSYAEGEELPRNAFKGLPFSRLDMRVAKTFGIPRTPLRLTGMVEVFNVFNTANYNGFNTTVNVVNFGRASAAGAPRTGQLAFRVEF